MMLPAAMKVRTGHDPGWVETDPSHFGSALGIFQILGQDLKKIKDTKAGITKK